MFSPMKPKVSNEAQHFDGEAMYGNPVLDAPPFDESLLGDLVSPDTIDMLDIGMDMGGDMGMSGAATGMSMQDQDLDQDQNMEVPADQMGSGGNGDVDMNRNDALQLLLRKAQARDQAAGQFQASALASNKQR